MHFFERFNARLNGLPVDNSVALAISGGPDSMALALLFKAWAAHNNVKLFALIIDHGLRSESALEAETVKKSLEALSLEAHILKWEGAKPKSRIQERAREARFDLLEAWCKKNGIKTLALGHHLDDVLETAVMRSTKKSGFLGLASIADGVIKDDLTLIRPLLIFSKDELYSFLKAQGQVFVRDPSNDNRLYERVRVRQKLERLSIAEKRELVEQIDYFRKYRALVEEVVQYVIDGDLSLSNHPFLPNIIQRIGFMLSTKKYFYSLEKIELFLKNPAEKTITFQCIVVRKKKDKLTFALEQRKKTLKPLEEGSKEPYLLKRGKNRFLFLPLFPAP